MTIAESPLEAEWAAWKRSYFKKWLKWLKWWKSWRKAEQLLEQRRRDGTE